MSKRDREKGLKIPTKLSEDLAYLCGVLIGDGHLQYRKDRSEYGIICVGHPIDENDFYDDVIAPLFKKVFGIEVFPKLYDGAGTPIAAEAPKTNIR